VTVTDDGVASSELPGDIDLTDSVAEAADDGALDPTAFYESLVGELAAARAALPADEASFGAHKPLDTAELVEWLKFQAWYELQAAHFIGAWLSETPETEIFCALARQVHDEARHYKIVMSQLEALGETMEDWVPEPEWVAWVAEFYPAGNDTLERVAAHNITGELGAAQGMEDLLPRVPPSVQKAIGRILPDERFHIALGRTTVLRYATTADAQRRVRERVMDAFALERAGRAAYDRRIAALSA
jgi:hypothetical protein